MSKGLTIGTTAPNFTFDTVSGQGLDFYKTVKGKKAVLFFLRYAGCPVCQLKIRDILRDHKEFGAAGLGVFVILQSVPSSVKEGLAGATVPFTIICDQDGKLFSLYRVAPGNYIPLPGPLGAQEGNKGLPERDHATGRKRGTRCSCRRSS